MRPDRHQVIYLNPQKSTDSFHSRPKISPFPHPKEFPQEIEKLEPHYFALGEVSNVWKCKLKTSHDVVAVKVMRGITSDVRVRYNFEQSLEKLVGEWKELQHPNVMICFGITMQFGPVPALIFPMCSEGSIVRYVKAHPNVNKLDLILQVVSGLEYLHSRDVVHADVRGSNIMINNEGKPLIMDAGLSLIISRADFTIASLCGPCRWMPPEILDPADDSDLDMPPDFDFDAPQPPCISPFTKASDIYSLAMTILEVYTGEVPFNHRRYDTVVILDVIRGVRPPRPTKNDMFSDGLWDLLHCCWQAKGENRPNARSVYLWIDLLRHTDQICTSQGISRQDWEKHVPHMSS